MAWTVCAIFILDFKSTVLTFEKSQSSARNWILIVDVRNPQVACIILGLHFYRRFALVDEIGQLAELHNIRRGIRLHSVNCTRTQVLRSWRLINFRTTHRSNDTPSCRHRRSRVHTELYWGQAVAKCMMEPETSYHSDWPTVRWLGFYLSTKWY